MSESVFYAVAVMGVEIDIGYPIQFSIKKCHNREDRVVEKAKSAGARGAAVVRSSCRMVDNPFFEREPRR